MSLPAAYLAKKLTQPLPIKGGPILRTVGETAKYILALPQRVARPLQIAGVTPPSSSLDQADVADVSRQVHLALFYDANLDINAMSR
jgi:hypothetical protein